VSPQISGISGKRALKKAKGHAKWQKGIYGIKISQKGAFLQTLVSTFTITNPNNKIEIFKVVKLSHSKNLKLTF
jgi:hypothetical protein